MIFETPCTNLEAARRNRERIEKIRKHEGGKRYTYEAVEQPTIPQRSFRRGIRGLRG